MHPRRFLFAAAFVLSLLPMGCGPRDPRVTIRGSVSLDGKPVSSGQVIFIPSESTLTAGGGALKDGQFTVLVHRGSHRVKVEAYAEERRTTDPNEPPESAVVYRSIIPQRYNEKTTLTFDVQSPSDRPEFALTSDK